MFVWNCVIRSKCILCDFASELYRIYGCVFFARRILVNRIYKLYKTAKTKRMERNRDVSKKISPKRHLSWCKAFRSLKLQWCENLERFPRYYTYDTTRI